MNDQDAAGRRREENGSPGGRDACPTRHTRAGQAGAGHAGTPSATAGAAEADCFAGRRRELARLRRGLSACRERPAAFYLHAPAGVGKSALLHAHERWARAHGLPVLAIDGLAIEPNRGGIVQAIGRGVARYGTRPAPRYAAGEEADVAAWVRRINRLAADQGPLLLLVDAYDELRVCDRWLRGEVFGPLQARVCLVLAGRLPPAHRWPEDLAWRRVLREIPLGNLDAADSAALLARLGVHEPAARAEAIAVTGGHPLLLRQAAAALSSPGFPEAATATAAAAPPCPRPGTRGGGGDLALLLTEHALHPGSARRTWRPDTGARLDELVAAVSQVPSFDRETLAALVGGTVTDADWADLCRLPGVARAGGRHTLPPQLRRRLADAVARQRPAAARLYRRRALERCLALAEADDEPGEERSIWHDAARVVVDAWLPAGGHGGGAQVGHGEWSRLADGFPRRNRSQATGAPAGARAYDPGGRSLVAIHMDGLLVVRRPSPACLTCQARVAVGPERRDALLGVPAVAASLRVLSPQAAGGTVDLCLQDAAPGTSGADRCPLFTLDREAFARLDRLVCVPADPEAERLLCRLGFRSQLGGQPAAGPRPQLLDLAAFDVAAWLRGLLAAADEAAPPPSARTAALQEALGALHDPERLAATALARHAAASLGIASPAGVRAWLLEAVAASGPATLPPPGQALLSLYYVQPASTHGAVAARLGLPRATYFRAHQRALTRLADSLLG